MHALVRLRLPSVWVREAARSLACSTRRAEAVCCLNRCGWIVSYTNAVNDSKAALYTGNSGRREGRRRGAGGYECVARGRSFSQLLLSSRRLDSLRLLAGGHRHSPSRLRRKPMAQTPGPGFPQSYVFHQRVLTQVSHELSHKVRVCDDPLHLSTISPSLPRALAFAGHNFRVSNRQYVGTHHRSKRSNTLMHEQRVQTFNATRPAFRHTYRGEKTT